MVLVGQCIFCCLFFLFGVAVCRSSDKCSSVCVCSIAIKHETINCSAPGNIANIFHSL